MIRIQNVLLISLTLIVISGCSTFQGSNDRTIQTLDRPLERTPLALQNPPPLDLDPLSSWIVVTEDNIPAVIEEFKRKGIDKPVFFALTPSGYQRFSLTLAEVRNFINEQRHIINQYKLYYEPYVIND